MGKTWEEKHLELIQNAMDQIVTDVPRDGSEMVYANRRMYAQLWETWNDLKLRLDVYEDTREGEEPDETKNMVVYADTGDRIIDNLGIRSVGIDE